MTRHTILGAATVLAVAAVGAVLGSAVAGPPAPRDPVTVITSVAEPSATGPDGASVADQGSGTAQTTAVIGVTGDSVTANALALLEVASSAFDPQAAATRLVAAHGFDSPDDSCVPTGQLSPTGCPEGDAGTVGMPFVTTILRAAVAPAGACGEADGAIGLEVATDGFAEVTVSWWAAGEAVRERTEQISTGCVLIDRLTPQTIYTVHVAVEGDWRRFTIDSSGAAMRPAAAVYAPTDDLIAVTVPHRAGETVSVYPNVLNGDEPRCDDIAAGYDLAVHELGRVSGEVDAELLAAASLDPDFAQRTTVAFDIGEGLTVYLCVVVRSADGEETYSAQTTVQTADRLSPVVAITQVSGRDLPGWAITAWLPSGQRCGQWRPDGPATNREVEQQSERGTPLCDTSDPIGPAARPDGEVAEGRGVLPFSSGDRATLTVNVDYPQVGPSYTTLDLGPTAYCTGVCKPFPYSSPYLVRGEFGTADLTVDWAQGSTNGATETSVGPVVDDTTVPLPGPQLDTAASNIRPNTPDQNTRGVSAALVIWADRPATYVARLVPAPGEAACERPGAVLEFSGELLPEPFNQPTFLEFLGLCHGTVYQSVVELTDEHGVTSAWGEAGALTSWGSLSRISVAPVDVAAIVQVDLTTTTEPAFLTLRVDGSTVVGPRWGGCPDADSTVITQALVVLPLGESTRFSGTVVSPNLASAEGCIPFWGSGRAGIPFEFEVSWDELFAVEGDPPTFEIRDESLRMPDGTATVIATITVFPAR